MESNKNKQIDEILRRIQNRVVKMSAIYESDKLWDKWHVRILKGENAEDRKRIAEIERG